ncbi:MAG: PIN domain-containing protein [Bacteroidetes bacterium]|nr:PIN domain-containing protein [Bacteroidota bacterium]MBI3482892.1 PIN domain-containing protein [Bacteroidota bacterium]
MLDKIFLDSNVCLYILDKHSSKFLAAKTLLENRPTISTQVILENINVCIKKFKRSKSFALSHARSLQLTCEVSAVTNQTITKAYFIFERYGYSIFDSLILATALQASCETLYSEDMQHGQIVENKITIINPFIIPISKIAL